MLEEKDLIPLSLEEKVEEAIAKAMEIDEDEIEDVMEEFDIIKEEAIKLIKTCREDAAWDKLDYLMNGDCEEFGESK